MLSKLIVPGCKVEIQLLNRSLNPNNEEVKKVYQSQVYDVLSEDSMEIVMPMEKTKLILLPVDGQTDITFYVGEHLYQCFARVVDRYKRNNMYILLIEVTSNLRRIQRREYYRFSCALEMCSRLLVEEEVRAIEQHRNYYLTPGLPLKRSLIVDISGGGLRFMSDHRYEPGSLIYCSYYLIVGGKTKQCETVGEILSVRELEHKKGNFEHRVRYVDMGEGEREEIIRYIFEEERKHRKKESDGN